MKISKLNTFFLALTLLAGSSFITPASNTISQFDWMLGSWHGKSGKGDMYENWRKHDEQTLLGEGFMIVKGDTVFKEIIRIQKIGNYWTYIPMVNKQEPVMFVLQKAKNSQWIFENKEHSYPQRIAYQQQPDGAMLAYIEGKMLGKTMKDEFVMQKVK